jgi:hypothetical protein
MRNFFIALLTVLSLSACGLAETAATGATAASSAAEQAKQGQQTEKRVQQQVEAANQLAADKLKAADAASSQ